MINADGREAGLADPANAVADAPSLPPRRHGAEAPDRDAMIAAMLAYVGELNTRYPLIRTRNSTYTFFAKDTAFANSLGVQQQRRRIWHYLRSHWLANSVFPGLAEIMDACEMAWNRFATNPGLIRSLCAVTWDPASPAR